MQHKGFAMVNDFSPCVTYNKFNTYDWYKEHVEEIPAGHDPSDQNGAWELLNDFDRREKLPLGIVYRSPRSKKAAKRLPIWTEELQQADVKPLLQMFR
jgi:2-oxoglutarate ferredoxin oxidoreductase subunit beta